MLLAAIVQMRGHTIWFYKQIRTIIPKLSGALGACTLHLSLAKYRIHPSQGEDRMKKQYKSKSNCSVETV